MELNYFSLNLIVSRFCKGHKVDIFYAPCGVVLVVYVLLLFELEYGKKKLNFIKLNRIKQVSYKRGIPRL